MQKEKVAQKQPGVGRGRQRGEETQCQDCVQCLCPASLCHQLFVCANTETALKSHALFRCNKLEREQISSLIFLGKGL